MIILIAPHLLMVIINSATARLRPGGAVLLLCPLRVQILCNYRRSGSEDSRRGKRARLPDCTWPRGLVASWPHSILCWVENSRPGRPAHRLLQKQSVYSGNRLISKQMVELNKIRPGGVDTAWAKCGRKKTASEMAVNKCLHG